MPSSSHRPPCRACTRPTRQASGLCAECDPPARKGKRPGYRVCSGGCGRMTTAVGGTCRACEPTYMKPTKVGPEHALRGGRWVATKRGIQVWQPV